MYIKKHPTGNEYLRAGDVWIRNMWKSNQALQLSSLYEGGDFSQACKNEEMNRNYKRISDLELNFKQVIIVNDGYKFLENYEWLLEVSNTCCILAVNEVLRKWRLYKDRKGKPINGYVTNVLSNESTRCLPKVNLGYFPVCIASSRTNADFLRDYRGDIYTYTPTPEMSFGYHRTDSYYVDDYRNPVVAAMNLAYRFNAEKILLFACDDSFEDERFGSVRLDNGLYTYPPLVRTQQIIDANAYWLTKHPKKSIKIADWSHGPKYMNASNIANKEEALEFLKEQPEENNNG